MEKVKKALDRIFIEGLSAMAHGLFATLIIGTIIQQIGTFMGGNIGEMIFIAGKLAASLTGAGIGVAVAYKFKEAPLVDRKSTRLNSSHNRESRMPSSA